MSQPQDDLVARASDPNAELSTLHELANNYPGLRPYIAENPRTYPALLEWLGTLGDPAVDAALARRNAAATTQALSLEQAQAAASGAAAPTQALSQSAITQAAGPDRRPIMERRQSVSDGAAPTVAYPSAQATAGYPQQSYPQQTTYPQAQPTAQAQPPAAEQGIFGVGTPESEERQHNGNRWLWVLGCIALVLVVALVVWFLTSDTDRTTTSAPASDTVEAPATQAPATTPAPTEASPTPSPTPTPTASQNLTAPAPDDALEMNAFTAPSGNISCVLSEDSVSCTINEHDFVPADASCNNSKDQAFTVSVGSEGEAQGSCGTSFTSTGASLNYGASAKNDTFACTSSESGIECWSQVSGQGFSLSRANAEPTSR
ncbi:hypothetical protein [Actinomyces sp. MRS3W]|uniref:variant leucine-rich repeat-containing protein n=1 Tax=Actinomyces sp. MRS3W TaxID=2800796 RepID=UPI0028FDB47D|nr:hypothetical protein [Actinomyces sp. MRS3W]MDU0349706.1 hypothetical protein [Actinomyces sp. MRS3W]